MLLDPHRQNQAGSPAPSGSRRFAFPVLHLAGAVLSALISKVVWHQRNNKAKHEAAKKKKKKRNISKTGICSDLCRLPPRGMQKTASFLPLPLNSLKLQEAENVQTFFFLEEEKTRGLGGVLGHKDLLLPPQLWPLTTCSSNNFQKNPDTTLQGGRITSG